MLLFVTLAHAADGAGAGCPFPPEVPDDGRSVPTGAIPPIDRDRPKDLQIASFALG